MINKMLKSKGFTLVEIVVSIAITILISLIVISTFASFNNQQVLKKETDAALSVLEKARSLTLSSKDSTQYGVRFQSNSFIFFNGASFSSSSPSNEITVLDNKVRIADINLSSNGVDVVFDRLKGSTSQNGTITFLETADSSKTKTITIYQTGLIESN
ncbi:MAG: type II secretion system protein [Candidatus Paceibacterota bacterium]